MDLYVEEFIKKTPAPDPEEDGEEETFTYFDQFRRQLKITTANIYDYLPVEGSDLTAHSKDIFVDLLNVQLVFKGARCGTLIDGFYYNGYAEQFARKLDPARLVLESEEDEKGNIYIWNIKILGKINLMWGIKGETAKIEEGDIQTWIANQQFLKKNIANMSPLGLYNAVKTEKTDLNVKAYALGYFTRDYLWLYGKKSNISVHEEATDVCLYTEIFDPREKGKVEAFYQEKLSEINRIMRFFRFSFIYKITLFKVQNSTV